MPRTEARAVTGGGSAFGTELVRACFKLVSGTVSVRTYHPYRLDFAPETWGVTPVNFDKVDAAEYIIDSTDGRGVDGVVDAVGFEAKAARLKP